MISEGETFWTLGSLKSDTNISAVGMPQNIADKLYVKFSFELCQNIQDSTLSDTDLRCFRSDVSSRYCCYGNPAAGSKPVVKKLVNAVNSESSKFFTKNNPQML